jgi:nitric oxide reductase NorD protein
MEEQVGHLWHRLVTRLAQDGHPEAGVELADMRHSLGVVFRALGGDGGLRIESAEAAEHGAGRRWLQRVAGSGRKAEFAWRDDRALYLPSRIDHFAHPDLNRELFLWLAASAAGATGRRRGSWLERNQSLVRAVLERYSGLRPRYRRLVAAHLGLRPQPTALPADEAAQERAVRAALTAPGSVRTLPVARRAPHPVPLWLHPSPPEQGADGGHGAGADGGPDGRSEELADERRRAERTDSPGANRGLIAIRMENIFAWAGFLNLDRGTDENEDLDEAAQAARDMERFQVARDGESVASRLRFDLDLPSAACDDAVVGPGIRLPEWDWRRQALLPGHCRILPMMAVDAPPETLPTRLAATAKRLRAQFQQLRPARTWRRAQTDGTELDLDAYLRFAADLAAGTEADPTALYLDQRPGAQDLACLLLADLSLSTDTWIDNQHRVIDVIRDSLFLFAESLAATGDRFALYGFSSRRRDPVRFHQLKTFDQAYDAAVRGRIQTIKPGYYTRMGAAVRRARQLLEAQPAARRLLLLLSDGKPNDLDQYEGRYGIEDTRQAVREARRAGIHPFCVTVDAKGNDYLPYVFGTGGYVVIRNPRELPRKLPLLYARLTREAG